MLQTSHTQQFQSDCSSSPRGKRTTESQLPRSCTHQQHSWLAACAGMQTVSKAKTSLNLKPGAPKALFKFNRAAVAGAGLSDPSGRGVISPAWRGCAALAAGINNQC
jgi:hypothetical protein